MAIANDDEIVKNLDFYENFESFNDESFEELLEEQNQSIEDDEDE